jgi:hypothetical protein
MGKIQDATLALRPRRALVPVSVKVVVASVMLRSGLEGPPRRRSSRALVEPALACRWGEGQG